MQVRRRGFTLVELLVVMTIMALLLSIAAPRYFDSHERAKEAALRADLRVLREAIDKHKADTGRLPETLDVLVTQRYVLAIPVDPITQRHDSWLLIGSPDPAQAGVYDVRSGAPGNGRDGTAYGSW